MREPEQLELAPSVGFCWTVTCISLSASLWVRSIEEEYQMAAKGSFGPRIGVEHSTKPRNHEKRGFSFFVKSSV